MKYTYAYRTSDGIRHEDSMNASSREEVFERLRERGIKAIKVVAADGSKANGAPPPRRIGWYVVAGILFAFVVAGVVWWVARSASVPTGGPRSRAAVDEGGAGSANGTGAQESVPPAATTFLTSQDRRQVIGDVAVVEKGIASGWADVFPEEGERFFASFAIPGVKAGQRNSTVEELNAALGRKVAATDGDGMEARQIKAMVEGMKEEARRYLAAGGTLAKYGERLVERQEAEIAIYNRVKSELEKSRATLQPEAFDALLEERNDELRNLGIRPIVIGE